MDIYQKKAKWKWYLAIGAVVIVAISMFYTKYLTDRLAIEEVKKVEQLKTAMETLSISSQNAEDLNCDVRFQNQVIESNTTIPILLVDDLGNPQDARNFGEKNDTSRVFMKKKLAEFLKEGKEPLAISYLGGTLFLYFEHSFILKLLTYYPLLQLILIAAFIGFGYLGFSAARRAEQNRVWVGMAKETAHQLGTPISGIIAWIEHLKSLRENDEELHEVLNELSKDTTRLELISDRFSKIGSAPELTPVDIYEELGKCREYMKPRSPRKVSFDFPGPGNEPVLVRINSHLFDWVVENLMRNALDSMDGKGQISAAVYNDDHSVFIDLSDTGKGIPASKFKTVFRPGYSTKKRGWGLGLSLAKRIIEEYHGGKIFVKKSTPGEETTFTIQLPK